MSRSTFKRPGFFALMILVVVFLGQACGTGGIKSSGHTADNEPQGDTDAEGARPLSSGSTQQGFIEYVGDSDWYRLEIPLNVDTVRFELSIDYPAERMAARMAASSASRLGIAPVRKPRPSGA